MRKLASIQKIVSLDPIPGADRIELARVEGWDVVVQKGIHKVGDSVVYFEIDSFLPKREPYLFLLKGSSAKRMLVDGKEVEGIRLKTIKLRGQISQGLILPLKELQNELGDVLTDGLDVTEQLGVLKYERPIPAELSGIAKGDFPSFIPKTDEERIQNMGQVLNQFYVTEKLDGSSVTYYKKDGQFGVCSRNLELEENDGTQWRLAKELDLVGKLPDNMAFQGEVVGEGIQGNPYKLKGQQVFFFNVYNISSSRYLDYGSLVHFAEELNLPLVPIVDSNYRLPKTVDEMLTYAEGKSQLNPDVDREGVVVRPKTEMTWKGRRLSFKAISNSYLLAHD